MSEQAGNIEINMPTPRTGQAFHIVLPWVAIIGILGFLGWKEHEPSQLEERQVRVERRLDAINARFDAQFDAIIRQLDRIENRLDRK